MDGAIGQRIVQPLAVFDLCIGRVRAEDEGEHGLHLTVVQIHEQAVGVDVLFDQVLRGKLVPHWVGLPLAAISCRARA